MNSIDTNDGNLKWEVFSSKRPGLSRDLPPGKEQLMWVSNSSTLIYGERDAVLVDTFLKLTAADDGTIVSAIASTARMNGMFRQMIKEIADVAASLFASSGKTAHSVIRRTTDLLEQLGAYLHNLGLYSTQPAPTICRTTATSHLISP